MSRGQSSAVSLAYNIVRSALYGIVHDNIAVSIEDQKSRPR
jgi:hypothetical protein